MNNDKATINGLMEGISVLEKDNADETYKKETSNLKFPEKLIPKNRHLKITSWEEFNKIGTIGGPIIMKSKKYVFELVIRESENLKKVCSTITACDYSSEELKNRKADHEILVCKDILLDQLTKEELKQFTNEADDYLNPDSYKKTYAFYHKPTNLWVYFLPNYQQRQVISLCFKNDATTFDEEMIYEFTHFLKSCSFNGIKNYGSENFLEFELKEI